MKKYFCKYPGTPPLGKKGDYRCSVHYGNTYRLDKAREEYKKTIVPIEVIVDHVRYFLEEIGVEIKFPNKVVVKKPVNLNYEKIKADNCLKSARDLIWMKFSTSGHLGVVAASNDINFDIPNSRDDYDKRIREYNSFTKEWESAWKHNSAGILMHQL